MLLRSVSTTRKPLALAIVLLLAALAPATAIIGFCARMPCCGHASADSLALATERADCCTTLTCYESPSARLAPKVPALFSLLAMPLLVLRAPNLPEPGPTAPRALIDTSPPRRTSDRLAVFSTLLI